MQGEDLLPRIRLRLWPNATPWAWILVQVMDTMQAEPDMPAGRTRAAMVIGVVIDHHTAAVYMRVIVCVWHVQSLGEGA